MKNAFAQNIIAMVWDFDKTLISNYMQEPLFKKYKVDAKVFWNEVNQLESHYANQGIHVNRDTSYLNHILTYVKQGIFKGLSNQILRECGKELEFYPGLPEFFPEIKKQVEENEDFKKHGISLEHYVVSTGFAETIRGSSIASYVDGIFGCEFIESPALPGFLEEKKDKVSKEISQVAIALDNTSKTRYLFEINKGSNKHPEKINVNSSIAPENRRIPFENMIYIADGPSDVPAFSVVKSNGGKTYAIYPKGNQEAFKQVNALIADGRIDMLGEADYSKDTTTYLWLRNQVINIANRIYEKKREHISKSASKAPKHI